ncbi:MAG: phosphate regulon sensor histidine kinase PhoR, partial [Gammaproteobacteria bacterium]|nr:phosphate regulon sensor histidine kinase PhoR [Gammaproteobacteria bacterium]
MMGGWSAALRRLLLGSVILLGIGFWTGQILLTLLLGALAYLAWNLVNLFRLESWISDPAAPNPPDVPGIWGQVFYRIADIQRKNRKQKKRMAKLLVEFRKSTEAMPDAAVVLDKLNHISWSNPASHNLLGLDFDRDRGLRIDNFVRTPAFRSYLKSMDFKSPLLIASPVSDEILLSVRIVPYGKGQRLMLARDITERAQLERMRRDFVANASHELRTPITVLSGYLESMQDDPEIVARWQIPVEEMRRQTERMERLVTDLLELSRLESATHAPESQRVDVRELFESVKADFESKSRQHASIAINADSDNLLVADPAALRSICQNLVSNALRFTPASGLIELGWRADGEGGYLSVKDNGSGIEAVHLPRLTERFYRADAGRSSEHGGTGLGLAIVKHAMERHGGRLEISSEPGGGSLFCCVFPAE